MALAQSALNESSGAKRKPAFSRLAHSSPLEWAYVRSPSFSSGHSGGENRDFVTAMGPTILFLRPGREHGTIVAIVGR
jgi:hypothetical protein